MYDNLPLTYLKFTNFATVSFGSSAAIGISVVYTIDSYRPIAGEVVVSQVVFKCKILQRPILRIFLLTDFDG